MICLAYAFLTTLRARAGDRGNLPSFEKVHRIVIENIVESFLINRGRFRRRTAKRVSPALVTEVLGIPEPTKYC